MAFTPTQFDSGRLVKKPVTAATFAKGDCMKNSSGNLVKFGSDEQIPCEYVAMETVSVTPTAGDLHLFIRTRGVTFEADTNAEPVKSTDVNIYADISSASTVNESASDDDTFFIEDVVGALADKKVRGFFNISPPNV